MKTINIFSAIAVMMILVLSSCEKSNVYEKNIPIEEYSWRYDQTLPFSLNIDDTTASYNILMNVRHTTEYNFTNLYVKLHTVYPSGKKGTLLKRIELGDNEEMQWLGECMNDICDRQAIIVEDVHFNEIGEYRFAIEQVMRTNPLPHIMSVGLRVEKDENI